ncbi:hypothetical protein HDU96_004595, partial [Phlyctochytrium bullatum]
YNKLAIGDLIKEVRRSHEDLEDNASILAKASFWATFGNTNRMSPFNYSADEGDASTPDDIDGLETLYHIARGRHSGIDEVGLEGTAYAWKNLRVLYTIRQPVILENDVLRVPVAIGDQDWTYLTLPRSVELENVLQKIKSEANRAKKELAIIELRGRETSKEDIGLADAEFVFAAFAKPGFESPPKKPQTTSSTNVTSPKTLREEEAAREAKRTAGSYQLVQGLANLPTENRFNTLLKLQGSEDTKREDLHNTTVMLYRNVKCPYTPVGVEEIKGENEKNPKLFSTSANIRTKGNWQATSRSGKGTADLNSDIKKYGKYVGLVGFIAAVYLK